MEYTMNMNDAAYDMAQLDELNDNYAVLLDYLNSPNFRSFGDGLKAIIRSKMPTESTITPQEFLQACCKDKGIAVASAATLYNWFHKGMRPDRAEQRREAMFALAFALELTVEETRKLFHKVYLDRAFNKRSYRELIYYHCLKRGNTYSYAQKLISLVSFSEDIKDATVRTEVISEQTATFADDMDLLAYIHNRPHNFTTTYYEADSTEQTGLNTEVIAAVIAPDESDSCQECTVSGLPAAIYEKDGRAYLCWTIMPELSCVLEYDPAVQSEEDMLRMAESVPANTVTTGDP